jgi:sugar phosphate isomerase/epimerase
VHHGPHHIAYCTNVHPGESLDDIEAVLRRDVGAVKARVSPDAPFGTGLRLGHLSAATLATSPDRLARLRDLLVELDLYVFTVNGFPYGDFAAASVKAAVYAPDWRTDARLEYTRQLAQVLAALPGPASRTISTVAGGFRPDTADAHAQVARGLARAATALAQVADDTGVSVRLCLEPEPWTTLETTADAVRFFERYVHPLGDVAAAHLGLCYDCCHQAVHFEDATQSLAALEAAGVTVGKIQVSSALHLEHPADPEARAALLAFDEPRYLHQTVGRTADGELLRCLDLPQLRTPDARWTAAEAWRTHFHVPIWWRGDAHLGTTREDWETAVRAAARCAHLEIETYTWHAIPNLERLGFGSLHDCVASEFAALVEVLDG